MIRSHSDCEAGAGSGVAGGGGGGSAGAGAGSLNGRSGCWLEGESEPLLPGSMSSSSRIPCSFVGASGTSIRLLAVWAGAVSAVSRRLGDWHARRAGGGNVASASRLTFLPWLSPRRFQRSHECRRDPGHSDHAACGARPAAGRDFHPAVQERHETEDCVSEAHRSHRTRSWVSHLCQSPDLGTDILDTPLVT